MNRRTVLTWAGWRERAVGGWLFLTLLCSVVACGESPRGSVEATPETEVASSRAEGGDSASEVLDSRPFPKSDAAEAPALPSDPSAAQASPLLALDPEGLRLVDRETGRSRSIAFGSPGDFAVESTSLALGPPVERGSSPECGTDYVSWEEDITITLRSDRFVGWFVRGDTSSLTTMSGIGVGSTRAELERVYVAQVAPSSLGTEFTAGGMAGLLASAASDARITRLWAGEVCLAR